MPSLYDLLSNRQLVSMANSTISVGNVIRCYVTNTRPPKIKRFIVLGKSNNGDLVGITFINSDINFNVINSQELIDLQHEIKANVNDFLDNDSFVDCSKLIKMDYSYIENAVVANPACIIGSVQQNDLEAILTNVKNSPNNSEILIEELGLI